MDRHILHSDLNGFYAAVSCLDRPDLQEVPVAVGGNPEKRHGIILAKNEIAKGYGVITGEALWQARDKCPDLVMLPPDYPKYTEYSRQVRKIYYRYTPFVEPFGLDEAWLDVTGSTHQFGSGMDIAETLRQTIKEEVGLTVSIGVSFNKIFAKFGSDYKKPDAVTIITRDNYKDLVWNSPASSLLYVGRATKKKLFRYGIETIGELAQCPIGFMKRKFGKVGEMLWHNANGFDFSPVRPFNVKLNNIEREVKSIGNGMTTPRDLVNDEDVRLVFTLLAESVGRRLRESGFYCRGLAIDVRDNGLLHHSKQGLLNSPTHITAELIEAAMALFYQIYDWQRPIRSLQLRAEKLLPSNQPIQVSFFTDRKRRERNIKVDQTIDALRRRYGYHCIQRGILHCDPEMGLMDLKAIRADQLTLPTNN